MYRGELRMLQIASLCPSLLLAIRAVTMVLPTSPSRLRAGGELSKRPKPLLIYPPPPPLNPRRMVWRLTVTYDVMYSPPRSRSRPLTPPPPRNCPHGRHVDGEGFQRERGRDCRHPRQPGRARPGACGGDQPGLAPVHELPDPVGRRVRAGLPRARAPAGGPPSRRGRYHSRRWRWRRRRRRRRRRPATPAAADRGACLQFSCRRRRRRRGRRPARFPADSVGAAFGGGGQGAGARGVRGGGRKIFGIVERPAAVPEPGRAVAAWWRCSRRCPGNRRRRQ